MKKVGGRLNKMGEKVREPIVHLLTVRDQFEAKRVLADIGSDPASHNIMAPKMKHVLIKIKDVDIKGANIIKQEMLAKGGEAAVAKGASTFTQETTDVVLMGTAKQYRWVLKNFRIQPHNLRRLVEPIERILAGLEPGVVEIPCGSKKLVVGGRTLIMGILNVTPDSFSRDGLVDLAGAVERGRRMVADGADILDIGGESTRPGAAPVDAEEEARRAIPIVAALAPVIDIPISIDTAKASVAQAAIDAGASIVNDITALVGDPEMGAVCAASGVAVILMHMRGEPRTMQENPVYDDLISDIIGFLQERSAAVEEIGVESSRILIDPGIGFGKTVADNLEIIRRLREFKSLGRPLVLGPSRKSTIGSVLNGAPVDERLEGTAAAVTAGILRGADIVRVHDVKEMAKVARMTDAIEQGADWRG